MKPFCRDVISIIRAALDGTAPTLSGTPDPRRLRKIAKYHQITSLIYYGAEHIPGITELEGWDDIFVSNCMLIAREGRQSAALAAVAAEFDRAGIDYLPLKGSVLKGLYPRPEMRTMGDADVLVKTEQYDRIREVMLGLGFEEVLESDHEYVWEKKDVLQIELHKKLIPSYNKDYYEYYGDCWRFAERGEHGFHMRAEDEFIYLLTHFAKHYRDAGAGIKYIVDFHLYLKEHRDLDFGYIETELEKLQLLSFWRNLSQMIDVWFEDAEDTEMSDFLTREVFGAGVWGKQENHDVSEGVKMAKAGGSARTRSLLTTVFLPYGKMCEKYPFLKKAPVLLPLMWAVRPVRSLLFNRKTVVEIQKKRFENMSSEKVSSYKEKLSYVGLDFNFGEDDGDKTGE